MTNIVRDRLKLSLIPILGLMLVIVVWPRQDASPAVSTKKQRLPEEPSIGPSRGTSNVAAWDIDFSAVRARNPFATPRFLQSTAKHDTSPASRHERPATQHVRVDAVLTTQDTVAAVVNGRIIRIGERVDDGRRVIAISHDAITISGNE